jgi:hypothetical protein
VSGYLGVRISSVRMYRFSFRVSMYLSRILYNGQPVLAPTLPARLAVDHPPLLFWTLEAVPFDPLKCIARLNVQCKKDWCVVEIYPEEQGFGPFT